MLMAVTESTIEEQADADLARWAKWTRSGIWLGYPRRSVTEAAREGFARGTRPPTALPDDVAATDLAVAQLRARHVSILARVIELRYQRGLPKDGVACALRCSVRKADNLLKRAQRAIYVLRS